MAKKSVVDIVRHYLEVLVQRGLPVQYGVLYGSQAQGEADEWSDIDLLVVSPSFDKSRRREDINLLWRTAAYTDSRIEPIPVGQDQYENDDSSPIIEIARRQGRVIALH